MSRYSTEPDTGDRERVRLFLQMKGVHSLARRPGFVAQYLARVLDDLRDTDDWIAAKKIAHARALVDLMLEERR